MGVQLLDQFFGQPSILMRMRNKDVFYLVHGHLLLSGGLFSAPRKPKPAAVNPKVRVLADGLPQLLVRPSLPLVHDALRILVEMLRRPLSLALAPAHAAGIVVAIERVAGILHAAMEDRARAPAVQPGEEQRIRFLPRADLELRRRARRLAADPTLAATGEEIGHEPHLGASPDAHRTLTT